MRIDLKSAGVRQPSETPAPNGQRVISLIRVERSLDFQCKTSARFARGRSAVAAPRHARQPNRVMVVMPLNDRFVCTKCAGRAEYAGRTSMPAHTIYRCTVCGNENWVLALIRSWACCSLRATAPGPHLRFRPPATGRAGSQSRAALREAKE
jgi:hypothetical protein